MIEIDKVRRFLREHGCPDEVVAAGLDGLVEEWERAVAYVEQGYPLGLDDYLNDLDGRQLLEDALELAAPGVRVQKRTRVHAADQRMKRVVTPTVECLWGERVAKAEGWDEDENWWYFRLPTKPGPLLRDDLKLG